MGKNNLNDQVPYLVIVAVVAVVAIVTLVLNGDASLDGADVFEITAPENERTSSCVDSDPLNDFFVKGNTQFGLIKNFDHCEGNNLFQYYCGTSADVRITGAYNCPNGCGNGACLR